MNTIREIEKINQEELDRGIAGTSASWHSQFEKSPWVYVGNLDHELSEGDVLCIMSQFGEVEDIHLVREEDTGKSRGFAFVKYEDSRSCILAVDNFIGVKVLGRSMRVDHVEKYRLPKKLLEKEEAEEARNLGAGHAYAGVQLDNKYTMDQGQDLFAPIKEDDKQEIREDRDEDKSKRKQDRKRKRQEKEDRRQRREERRAEREEDKGQLRSQRYKDGGGSDEKREKKRKHKKRRRHRDDRSPSSTRNEDNNS